MNPEDVQKIINSLTIIIEKGIGGLQEQIIELKLENEAIREKLKQLEIEIGRTRSCYYKQQSFEDL
jgi:hypothetical protein